MNMLQSDNSVALDAGSSNPFVPKGNDAPGEGPTARSASLIPDSEALPPAPKQPAPDDDKPFVWVSF
jgi:hypothetical protein